MIPSDPHLQALGVLIIVLAFAVAIYLDREDGFR